MSTVRKPVHTSTLAAVTAVVVSFASLYVAWRQGTVMERQLAASVWPALQFTSNTSSVNDRQNFSFGFRNSGIGPARIRAFDLSFAGNRLHSWQELLAACCGRKDTDVVNIRSARVVGRMLAPGERFEFFSLERSATSEQLWQKLDQARSQLTGHLCYCSALEECWFLDIDEMEPSRVASCRTAARDPQYGSR